MLLPKKIIYGAVALSVISCGGGSSSSDNLELPSFVSLIQEQSVDSKNQPQNLVSPLAVVDPLPASGTDFFEYQTRVHGVENPGDFLMQLVNGALCFVNQTNPADNVGAAAYRSLVDEGSCFNSNSAYQDVVSQVTRSGSQYQVDLWWSVGTGNQAKVRFLVHESSSDNNPYGRFELFMLNEINSGAQGTKLHLIVDVDNEAADDTHLFKMIGDDLSSSGGQYEIQAVAHTTFDGSSGGAKITDIGRNSQMIYANNLIKYTETIGSNSPETKCLNRNNTAENVFGYTLFTEAGERVDLVVGFGFSYDNNGVTEYGYVDRYGVWPSDLFVVNGDYTINRHSNNQDYTLTASNGGSDISVAGVNFGEPIEFDAVTFTTADSRNGESAPSPQPTMIYFGEGSMGIFGGTANNFGIDFSLKDGVVLTKGSTNYIVKATDLFVQAEDATNASDCDSLGAYPDYQAEFDALELGEDSEYNMADTPTAPEAPKYVGGRLVDEPTGS